MSEMSHTILKILRTPKMFQRPNLLGLFLKKFAVDTFCVSNFPELSRSQVCTSKAASRIQVAGKLYRQVTIRF